MGSAKPMRKNKSEIEEQRKITFSESILKYSRKLSVENV